MRQLLNFIQQYPIVIYLALAIGLPMIGRIIKGVKDRRAAAERKRLIERAEMEALRTGRTAGSAEYVSSRAAAPLPMSQSPQPMPQSMPQSAPAPQPAQAPGQPRYVQLPGGVILELPPAPTGPVPGQGQASGQGPGSGQGAGRRPVPRPPQRSVPQRTSVPRPQAPMQRPTGPVAQPRPQAPRDAAESAQQADTAERNRRRQADRQTRAEIDARAREERLAEERRQANEERLRAAREEKQRQQTADIVAEAYRQTAEVAGGRSSRGDGVRVGGMKVKPQDWRRIMVLREIMDPPITMRDGS